MPSWSPAQYAQFLDRVDRIRAGDPQPTQGDALVDPAPRKSKSSPEPVRCIIRFTIYAVRPADWDGYHIKELQDCLVHAGLLDGDEWDRLEGYVTSKKVHTKTEEKTIIEVICP
jgi:hypothetical protein